MSDARPVPAPPARPAVALAARRATAAIARAATACRTATADERDRRGRAGRCGDAALGRAARSARWRRRSPRRGCWSPRRAPRRSASCTSRSGSEGEACERPIGVVARGADAATGWRCWRRAGVDPRRDRPRADAAAAPRRGICPRRPRRGSGVVRGPYQRVRRRGAADRAGHRRRAAADARPRRAGGGDRRGAGRARRSICGRGRSRGGGGVAIDWALVRRLALAGRRDPGGDAGDHAGADRQVQLRRRSRWRRRPTRSARTGLPRGETVNDADRQLDERLSRLRGAGAGLHRDGRRVFAAVRAVPGTE